MFFDEFLHAQGLDCVLVQPWSGKDFAGKVFVWPGLGKEVKGGTQTSLVLSYEVFYLLFDF